MKRLLQSSLAVALALGLTGVAAAQNADRPMADAAAAHNPAVKSPTRIDEAPLAKGHNSFTRGEAESRLHDAGYQHVTGLRIDHDGLWQGRAMRHGSRVRVALDYKGNVSPR